MKEKIKKIFDTEGKIIYGITGICLLVAVTLLIFLPFTKAEESGVFPLQTVEGLRFSEGRLTIENGVSRYNVDVENTETTTKNFTMIEVIFRNEKGEEESIYGYIGEKLLSKEKKVLEVSVEEDLTQMTEIEYIIH